LIPKKKQAGNFFHQEPCSIWPRAIMVIEWVVCCGSQIFTIAHGTNFYSEKVAIFIAQKWLFPKEKRFLVPPETEKPVSDCLYIFNK